MSKPNPYVVGTLLVLGFGTLWWVGKKTNGLKKKNLNFFIFTDSCEPIPIEVLQKRFKGRDLQKLSEQVVASVVEKVGGFEVLGDPPGDSATNLLWSHAVATRLLRVIVTPTCIKSLGLTGEQNQFGLDYFPERSKMPEHIRAHFVGAVLASVEDLNAKGYEVDFFGGLDPQEIPGVFEEGVGAGSQPLVQVLMQGLGG